MNKLSLSLGFLILSIFFGAPMANAGEVIKAQVVGVAPTELEYALEIKTNKFEEVILDCQSLRMGMSFKNKGEIYADIYLNEMMCSEIMEFIYTSHVEKLPVCLGVDRENQELTISRETDACN